MKLRLLDQQNEEAAAPTALAAYEPDKAKPEVNAESPQETVPKQTVITEDESFDNLDKLIDEALVSGQEITVEKPDAESAKASVQDRQDDIDWLIKAKPDLSLSPFGETEKILSGSNEIKKAQKLQEMTGKVVVWRLPVREVRKAQFYLDLLDEQGPDDLYYLYLWSTGSLTDLQLGKDDKESIGVAAFVTPLNQLEKNYLDNLAPGTWVTIKGLITGQEIITSLVLRPAIMWDEKQNQ